VTSPFSYLFESPPLARATDEAHMMRALREAHRGVGRTAPNPPVGAVLVPRGGRAAAAHGDGVSVGFHAKAGERHAEIVALDDAAARGTRTEGATLYVSLEPCVHQGRTPPCVQRILADGIGRVVVGAVDPNPRVHGQGIAALRAAGVVVDVLTLDADRPLVDECHALIAPFARATVDQAPYVVLKVASSLDGRVAAANGASRWITGEASRALVHRLRDAVDVVVVGAGTVLADDPSLTVRAPPDVSGRNPLRAVIDYGLRTSPTSRVYQARAGEPPPVVVHGPLALPARMEAFRRAGVLCVAVPTSGAHVDVAAALRALVPLGVMAALIEGGPGLATAALQAGVVDELWWFHAPVLLGADAVPAAGALGLSAPAEGPRFAAVHRAITGDDTLAVLRPSRAGTGPARFP
jgi:diaminohydroxyphosphoribosylaminopyrimidine deaminase/5-amino-6-(5-phosphoribosylamino)uracil reductase